MDIAIRSGQDVSRLAAAARSAIRSVDAEQPVTDVMTLEAMRRNEVIGLTYTAVLMSVFGLVALALSCVGVYGMTAYLVSRQTHEIGIRMALGAGPWAVLGATFRRALRPSLAGMVVGVLLSLGVAKVLSSAIWGIGATDWAALAGAPLLLLLAAGLATYVPVRRAVRINPVVALRNE